MGNIIHLTRWKSRSSKGLWHLWACVERLRTITLSAVRGAWVPILKPDRLIEFIPTLGPCYSIFFSPPKIIIYIPYFSYTIILFQACPFIQNHTYHMCCKADTQKFDKECLLINGSWRRVSTWNLTMYQIRPESTRPQRYRALPTVLASLLHLKVSSMKSLPPRVLTTKKECTLCATGRQPDGWKAKRRSWF